MANMTTDEVLEVVRQRVGQAIGEIGGNAPTYPDDFLIKYVKSANFELLVYGVVTSVTVDVSSVLITPDPTVAIGMLLAFGASADIIGSDLLDRLKNGELGISFTSGASAISTNQAGSYLKQYASGLKSEYDNLLAAYLSGDPNGVLGRDQ